MPSAFISYRRVASAMLAQLIADRLNQQDIDTYLDVRRADGSGPFPERTLRAIETHDVFVCIIGEGTFESEWVKTEIQHAHQVGKILIPVFQESYDPVTDWPDEHVRALLQSQGVTVLDQQNLYVDEAIKSLANLIKVTRERQRRTRIAALVLAVAVIALTVVILLLSGVFSGGDAGEPISQTDVENTFIARMTYAVITPSLASTNMSQLTNMPEPTPILTKTSEPTLTLTSTPKSISTPQPTAMKTNTPEPTLAPTNTPKNTSSPVPTPMQTPPPTDSPMPTPLPTTAPENINTDFGFAYGIQVHLPSQDSVEVMGAVQDLGVTWVKQQIDWELFEPNAGDINWDPLDEMVDAMDSAEVNVLFMVTSAPSWARTSDQENGPPYDPATYANFVGQLAARYQGRVDAYEIWNEPNLRREWNTQSGIVAEDYVELLTLAYIAIKTADPAAVVVSGGLAPTGFNDGVNAIDDRVYLRLMYEAGVANWSDAIGAHPNGWANPPDSLCCRNNRPAVPGWDDHPSFFFRQTLSDYREIMIYYSDSDTFIWPTEFGWGSNDGLNVEPGVDFSGDYTFVSYTSLDEQAYYVTRAFQLGREWGYIGPMFLWNLNFCPVVGVTGEQCMWSLLDSAGDPRPVYLAVRNMDK